MSLSIGNISIYHGPQQIGAPDDLKQTIINFISEAQHTLDVAIQELEQHEIAEALIERKQQGVKVRVVMEGDYLIEYPPQDNPWSEGGPLEENRTILNALCRAGIQVRTDYNNHIFHQKFIVRDAGKSTRGILTGSTNFTPTGVESNLNHVVTVRDGNLTNEYQKEFDEIWDGTFGKNRSRHESAPRNNRVSGVKVRAVFAPDHAPEMEIMKQMMKASSSIDFAIFTFSGNSSGIDDAMIAMQKANVNVRGVFDPGQGNREWAASHAIADSGAEVYLANYREGLNKLHHKMMVIDDTVVILGSFNYTGPANKLNDENILIIGDIYEEDPDSIEKQKQIAVYCREEIDRMIDKHGEPLNAE